jgi:hypothetical protein
LKGENDSLKQKIEVEQEVHRLEKESLIEEASNVMLQYEEICSNKTKHLIVIDQLTL